MAITETLMIAAPLTSVWALIDDPNQLPLWMPDVIETVYPDGRPDVPPVGTRFIQRVRESGRVTEYQGVVTGHQHGQYLAIALSQPLFKISIAYRLTPAPVGTRLDFSGDLVMHNPLMRLMALAAWPMTSAILKRQIAALKRVAEAEAAALPKATRAPTKSTRAKPNPAAAKRKSK